MDWWCKLSINTSTSQWCLVNPLALGTWDLWKMKTSQTYHHWSCFHWTPGTFRLQRWSVITDPTTSPLASFPSVACAESAPGEPTHKSIIEFSLQQQYNFNRQQVLSIHAFRQTRDPLQFWQSSFPEGLGLPECRHVARGSGAVPASSDGDHTQNMMGSTLQLWQCDHTQHCPLQSCPGLRQPQMRLIKKNEMKCRKASMHRWAFTI